jgi:hypothetical protein
MDGPATADTKPTPPAQQVTANPSTTPKPDAGHADATPVGRPSHNVTDTKPPVAAAPQPNAATQPTAAPREQPGVTRENLHVGMGEKGRGYGHTYIAVAAASLWAVKERMAIDMIKHAMDLYKADHDGKAPKTHEEFMQKIIKENDIKLPVLPEGNTYEYDPTTEELMVRVPQDPNAP